MTEKDVEDQAMITEYQFQDASGRVVNRITFGFPAPEEDYWDSVALTCDSWSRFRQEHPGAKLVRVLKESHETAQSQRFIHIQYNGIPKGIYMRKGTLTWVSKATGETVDFIEEVDKARNAPKPKITVIRDGGKEAK